MKAQILKPGISAVVGLFLTLPAVYFILINLLNDAGITTLYGAAEPLLEKSGISKPFSWINLLIVFGPLLALLLNVTSVLSVYWHVTKTIMNIQFHIEKRWGNFFVTGLSGSCLLIFFLYLFAENCS